MGKPLIQCGLHGFGPSWIRAHGYWESFIEFVKQSHEVVYRAVIIIRFAGIEEGQQYPKMDQLRISHSLNNSVIRNRFHKLFIAQ